MSTELVGILGLGVAVLTMAGGALVAYGRLDGRVGSLEKGHGALEAGLAGITAKIDGLSTQLATLLGELRERARHERGE